MNWEDSLTPAHHHNRAAWDRRVRQGARFTEPAEDTCFQEWREFLDRSGWTGGGLRGRHVLCLGAGGGKHGPLFATGGAHVTVVDISPAMLELDRQVAAHRSLQLRTVETSMDNLQMLREGEFDLVTQPVSTCYVPDIGRVYREVARVLTIGGLYLSQHKQPASLQADVQWSGRGYAITEPYYRSGPLPAVAGSLHREEGTLEYLHRWDELIGELCRAGFVLEDLTEPRHGKKDAAPSTFAHRSCYVPPYVRLTARRVGAIPPQRPLLISPR